MNPAKAPDVIKSASVCMALLEIATEQREELCGH